jgi:hypothetical protein
MTTEGDSDPRPEKYENHFSNDGYSGDHIAEGSLENISRLQATKEQPFTFIWELLIQFLLEELPWDEPIGDELSNSNNIENSVLSCAGNLISL